MLDENYPLVFWYYSDERRFLITNVIEKDLFQLRVQTTHFATFFEEEDISNIYQFGWYEWVYYRETTSEFPFPPHVVGHCLGPAKNEVNDITKQLLKQNWQLVPHQTMRRLTPDELVCDSQVKNRAEFDATNKLRYGDQFTLQKKIRGDPKDADDTCDLHFDDLSPYIPEADIVDSQGKPLHPTSSNGYFDEC